MAAQAHATGFRKRNPVFSSGPRRAWPGPSPWLRAGILLWLALSLWPSAFAAQKNLAAEGPPTVYRLEDASVRLIRQPGNVAFPVWRVTLSGTGNATQERGGQKASFHYAPKDFLVLLNEFYRIRFFELPTDYGVRYSLFLKGDGLVGTSLLRMSDESSTRVCVSVAAYEKCITYSTHGPTELENIAARISSEAEKFANVRRPPEK